MNHYPHHIGDFNTATRHLSRLERAIYRDMRDMYCDAEAPLDGSDMGLLARRLLCREPDEVAALQFVLAEYFTRLPDGRYQNAECDQIIAQFRLQQEEREEVKSNEVVRQKRSRARRSAIFAALRSVGVVPAAKAKAAELMALCRAHGIVVTESDVLINGVSWIDGAPGGVTPRHDDVTGGVTPRHGDDTGNQNQNQNQLIPPNPPDGGASGEPANATTEGGSGGLAIAMALSAYFPEQRRTRLLEVAEEVAKAIADGVVTGEELLQAAQRQQRVLAEKDGKACPSVLRWVREQRWLDLVGQEVVAAGCLPADWDQTRSGVEGVAARFGMPSYDTWAEQSSGQGQRLFPAYEAEVRALLAAQGVPA